MGFDTGSISAMRYHVAGQKHDMPDEDLLDSLKQHRLQERSLGIPDEVEWGWCGGRHIYDGTIDFGNNVYNDAIHFGLRVDTNKVPGEVKKAYLAMEVDAAAAGNPSGFASKQQKRQAKDSVDRQMDEELTTGKYRRSRLIPLLWDLPGVTLHGPASLTAAEQCGELFNRTFSAALEPLTAGTLALSILEKAGRRRDYEDVRPTRFAVGPDGENQPAEYPWTAAGDASKDFLGNEYLMWLWHIADTQAGTVRTDAGDFDVLFERTLELDCTFGMTGKDTLRETSPTRMPEARDALRSGKVPRKAGLTVAFAGQQYSLNLNAERLAVSTLKLPAVEEADTPRTLFEERITLLRDFWRGFDASFAAFIKLRCSGAWDARTSDIRRWINTSGRPMAAVA